jgi:hypothetical protein
MNDEWKHFPQIWLARGTKTDDPFFRFFCFYIAFNRLYALTGSWDEPSAKILISNLVFNVLDDLGKNNIVFDVDPEMFTELRETIWEGSLLHGSKPFHRRQGGPTGQIDFKYRAIYCPDRETGDPRWEMVDLFIKINIARNNLFHGWKLLDGPGESLDTRNPLLMKESCLVLQRFLEAALQLEMLPTLAPNVLELVRAFEYHERKHRKHHENHSRNDR